MTIELPPADWSNHAVHVNRDITGQDIFCPDDIWELVHTVPGWSISRARSEWPWHNNGSQNRDIYFEFVFVPNTGYNEVPFGLRIPKKQSPRNRDDHRNPQGVTRHGKITLWSERGDNSCGVIFVVFTPNAAFLDKFHYKKESGNARKERQAGSVCFEARPVLQEG